MSVTQPDSWSEYLRPKKLSILFKGNGQKTRDQEKAYNFLLQRDFPDYNFEDGQQKKVLCTPPYFLPKRLDLPRCDQPEFELVQAALKPGTVSNLEADDFE